MNFKNILPSLQKSKATCDALSLNEITKGATSNSFNKEIHYLSYTIKINVQFIKYYNSSGHELGIKITREIFFEQTKITTAHAEYNNQNINKLQQVLNDIISDSKVFIDSIKKFNHDKQNAVSLLTQLNFVQQ